jgi:hypothetical protein
MLGRKIGNAPSPARIDDEVTTSCQFAAVTDYDLNVIQQHPTWHGATCVEGCRDRMPRRSNGDALNIADSVANRPRWQIRQGSGDSERITVVKYAFLHCAHRLDIDGKRHRRKLFSKSVKPGCKRAGADTANRSQWRVHSPILPLRP